MKIDDFKKKLDIHGGDLSRWPQEDIKPAYALIRDNRDAAALFAAAEALDNTLRLYQPGDAALEPLAARILQKTQGLAQDRSMPVPPPPALPLPLPMYARAGGLIAAALLGFYISVYPAIGNVFSPADSPLYAQEQAINDGNADIYQL